MYRELLMHILSFGMLFSGFLGILLIPLLRLTLDRRVRKALPKDKAYDSYLDAYGGLGRTMVFGLSCSFSHVNNAPMYRQLYDNFNIAAFANRFEKCISYIMAGSFIILITFSVLTLVLEFFGVIDFG